MCEKPLPPVCPAAERRREHLVPLNCAGSAPGGDSRLTGMTILQRTPCAANARSTWAPSERARLPSMTKVPKPRRAGGPTPGPPLSAHSSSTPSPSLRRHAIQSRPSGTESAPNFSALLASSCSASPEALRDIRLQQHPVADNEDLRPGAIEIGTELGTHELGERHAVPALLEDVRSSQHIAFERRSVGGSKQPIRNGAHRRPLAV